jgi:phage shock protein E
MKHLWLIAALSLGLVGPASAQVRFTQPSPGANPLIDYQGYLRLAAQTQPMRAKRLLTLEQFKAKSAQTGTLVLDARSAQAFAEGHIAGAVNLPLPDFNAASLREIIGANPNRPILIYCNNNFTNDVRPVPTKVIQVALNIQTFINLRAYGYQNVWELGEAVDLRDARVGWVGTETETASRVTPRGR